MLRPRTLLLICALLHASFVVASQGAKSKLCANDICSDALFTSKIIKTVAYPDLLNVPVGETVEVIAVKFSDRPDMLEARYNGVTGRLYGSSIEPKDYVDFLKFSIAGKKEYKLVAQEVKPGTSSVLGIVKSDLELVRDYNVKAQSLENLTGEKQEMMEIPQPAPQKGHGHSHSGGGHGHSHDHHGHSHDAADGGHGHSHDAPAAAAPVSKEVEGVKLEEVTEQQQPPLKTEEVKPEAAAIPESPQEPAPVAAVDPEKPAKTQQEIDDEVMRMMEADMKKLEEEKEAAPAPVDATATAAPAAAAAETEALLSDAAAAELSAALDAEEAAAAAAVPPAAAEPSPVTPPVEEVAPAAAAPTPAPEVVVEEAATTVPPPPTPAIEEPAALHLPPLTDPATTTVPPPTVAEEVTTPVVPATAKEEIAYCYGKDECPPGSLPPPPPPHLATDAPVPTTTTVAPLPAELQEPVPADPIPSPAAAAAAAADPFADLPSPSNFGRIGSGGGRGELQSHFIAATLRSALPSVFGAMTDGSIGFWLNVSFVLGALVLVGVSKVFCDGVDSVVYDRAAAHNLSTALKACQAQLAVREAEIASAPRGVDPAIMQRAEEMAHHIRQLETRLQHVTGDLERKTAEAEEACRKMESSKEVIANAEMRASAAEVEWRKKEEEVGEMRAVIERSRGEMERIKEDEKKERKAREASEAEAGRLKKRVIELEGELEEAERRQRESVGEMKRLESEVAEMAKLMEDMETAAAAAAAEEKGSEKSAGEKENGWDDDDWGKDEQEEKQTGEGSSANGSWSHGEEEERERTLPVREVSPAAAAAAAGPAGGNLREMCKLRSRAAQLEAENESLRASMERERGERTRLEKERAALAVETEKLAREVAEKERERREANDRLSESYSSHISLLKGVEARNDRLSEEVTRVQTELRTLEEEKRRAEERLREVEAELKRLRNDHLKLETRHYTQTTELRKQLQTATQLAAPVSDLLNLSGASSLDDRMGGGGAGPVAMDSHSSLWDEPSEAEIQSAVHSTRRTPSSELLGGGGPSGSRRSVRSRRSDRFVVDPGNGSPLDSGSGGEQAHLQHLQQVQQRGMTLPREVGGPVRVDPMQQPQRRMRSRSHGRVPTSSSSQRMSGGGGMYGGGGGLPPPGGSHYYMDYAQPMYGLDDVARRHSRSGQQLYYSSGGSNGGRSPPPEMPLLPALPPPGVRKPSSKRATGGLLPHQ